MVNKTYSLINTELHKPIRSTSLSGDQNGIDYRDIHLQEIVRDAFPNIFPSIVQIDKQWVYQLLSKNGKDRCTRSTAINKFEDIPATEVNKLLEGWITIRRKAMEKGLSNNLHSILLNFRVPHPEKSIDCYRIEKRNGKEKLIVLWGYESDSTPSISLEKALAIMLGVQKKSLNKILQKSLSEVKQGEKIKVDTNFVNAIPQSVPTASVLVHDRVKAPERNSKNTALISVLTISLIGTGLWGSGIFEKKESDTAQLTQQPRGSFLENKEVSNIASEPITIQPPREAVPTQPIIPEVDPDIKALNQLQQKRESRASLIEFFKSEKSVTETKKGLLKCSIDSSEKIKTIVNNENQDRLSLFNLKAKINKITTASVVATFATSMGVDITQTEKQTVLRIHGSNTVGASLAPKLMTQFLRSQGINNIKMNKEGV